MFGTCGSLREPVRLRSLRKVVLRAFASSRQRKITLRGSEFRTRVFEPEIAPQSGFHEFQKTLGGEMSSLWNISAVENETIEMLRYASSSVLTSLVNESERKGLISVRSNCRNTSWGSWNPPWSATSGCRTFTQNPKLGTGFCLVCSKALSKTKRFQTQKWNC